MFFFIYTLKFTDKYANIFIDLVRFKSQKINQGLYYKYYYLDFVKHVINF